MDVLEAIRSQRSASRFRSTPLPEETIHAVFNAARMAPSVENRQPWAFVVLSDEDLRTKVRAVLGNANARSFSDAPVIVVACARLDEAEGTVGGYMNSYPLDLGLALAHLTLAATQEGLATSWVFAFNEAKVKAAIGIPDDVRVVGLTPLGYPEDFEPASGRKHLNDILHYNRFG